MTARYEYGQIPAVLLFISKCIHFYPMFVDKSRSIYFCLLVCFMTFSTWLCVPLWGTKYRISIQFICRPFSACSFHVVHLVDETSEPIESHNLSFSFKKISTSLVEAILNHNQASPSSVVEHNGVYPSIFKNKPALVTKEKAIVTVAKTLDVFNPDETSSSIHEFSASEQPYRSVTESISKVPTGSPSESYFDELESEPTFVVSSSSEAVESNSDSESQLDESYSSSDIVDPLGKGSSKKEVTSKTEKTHSSKPALSKKTKKTNKRPPLFSGGKDTKERERILANRKIIVAPATVPDAFETQWRTASVYWITLLILRSKRVCFSKYYSE